MRPQQIDRVADEEQAAAHEDGAAGVQVPQSRDEGVGRVVDEVEEGGVHDGAVVGFVGGPDGGGEGAAREGGAVLDRGCVRHGGGEGGGVAGQGRVPHVVQGAEGGVELAGGAGDGVAEGSGWVRRSGGWRGCGGWGAHPTMYVCGMA